MADGFVRAETETRLDVLWTPDVGVDGEAAGSIAGLFGELRL